MAGHGDGINSVPLCASVMAPHGSGFQDLIEVVKQAMDAYQLMREGKLKGRAVMRPNG
jgi:hypothetical protein